MVLKFTLHESICLAILQLLSCMFHSSSHLFDVLMCVETRCSSNRVHSAKHRQAASGPLQYISSPYAASSINATHSAYETSAAVHKHNLTADEIQRKLRATTTLTASSASSSAHSTARNSPVYLPGVTLTLLLLLLLHLTY